MSDSQAFKLIIEDDEGRRSIIPVELGEVSIGRLEACTIRLNERNVSRQHAKIRKETGHVHVEDSGSYNGVFINGDRIKGRTEIREGDLIKIGDFHLELRGEGLQRRTEETTQRTTLQNDREATQPEIRMSDVELTAPGPMAPLIPNANRTPPRPMARQEEDAERHEATAIIRLDAPELQGARGGAQTLAGDKAKLVCVSTQYAGREYEISKSEIIIGRTEENDIAIDHRSVSRQHAKVVVEKNRYRLVDMKSANGTLVNGEEYAQTELKRGDLIELGHVKFRFVPAGESYTLGADELQAVKAGRSGAANDPQMNAAPKAMSMPLLVGGALGLLVLFIIVIAVVMSGDDGPALPAPPGLGAPPAPPSVPQSTGNKEIDGLLGRAQVALSQRHWSEADTLGKAIQTLDPQNPQAGEIISRAQLESRAEQSINGAKAAMAGNDWGGAHRLLRDIPENSVYRAETVSLLAQVKDNHFAELLRSAREALNGEEWQKASGFADEMVSLDPGRPEGAEIRSLIEASQSPSRPRGPGTKQKALQNGNGNGGTPVSRPPPTKAAPTGGGAGKDAKSVYGEGITSLKGGDLQSAIASFTQCVQIDANFGLCYRALGIAYAKSGNGAKAARYYKQYLKVSPNAPDAEQVRTLLEQYETAP